MFDAVDRAGVESLELDLLVFNLTATGDSKINSLLLDVGIVIHGSLDHLQLFLLI